jgi:hypothetical protein
MNASSGGTTHTLTPSSSTHQYLSAKRCNSAQSSLSTSAVDLRELTNTLQELNTHFKKNIKILSEIKDSIVKVHEKQETRPVDETSGVHKLDTVCMKPIMIKYEYLGTLRICKDFTY